MLNVYGVRCYMSFPKQHWNWMEVNVIGDTRVIMTNLNCYGAKTNLSVAQFGRWYIYGVKERERKNIMNDHWKWPYLYCPANQRGSYVNVEKCKLPAHWSFMNLSFFHVRTWKQKKLYGLYNFTVTKNGTYGQFYKCLCVWHIWPFL